MAVIALVVGLVSCSDDSPENFNVGGSWFWGRMTSTENYDYTAIDLASNSTYVAVRSVMNPGQGAEKTYSEIGTWSIEGKDIVIMPAGGGTDRYTLLYADGNNGTMILSLRGVEVTWYRRASDLPKQ